MKFDQHIFVLTEHTELGCRNRKPWNNISAERARILSICERTQQARKGTALPTK